MQCAGKALEELLVSAKSEECLTVGVYESAKGNVDPDCVAFCVLATDEEYECDIALQIHFTLIQAFCFDNDIDIVRVNDTQRLAEILGNTECGEPEDVHCILVTNPSADTFEDPALEKLSLSYGECRGFNEWVPAITLPEC
ncbi:growth arrest and DNA damage-inducible protein GADD45 gamma-like [Polyodon spathula]|uniref:growth arrest and DNA damage-inducible protein GADD45 gamma-like n=1 Tax=Polyodon spathula TaxID=7913 RepID=UPI001B7EBF74|nr:growth arrest and DNA damage-inducible protein GADD45 gamma-like [Polyodon spathula]